MAGIRRVARPRGRNKWVPFGYLGTILVVAFSVLPSALRPPPDSAGASGALSPDAPPDATPDQILQAITQAGSRTAGALNGGDAVDGEDGDEEDGDGPATTTTTTLPTAPSRSQCYGSPPRQLESVYAPPCQPAFVGDNGGRTARGVSANDIRVALVCFGGGCGDEGEITESSQQAGRTLNALRTYFNQRLELYGRQLRFFVVGGAESDEPAMRAAARRAVEAYDVFAALNSTGPGYLAEFAELRVPVFTRAQLNQNFHLRHSPWVWESTFLGDDAADHSSDYLCKKLAGKKPFPTGDTAYIDYDQPRKFGLISFGGGEDTSTTDTLLTYLRQRCGVRPDPVIEANVFTPDSPAVATAVAQMAQGRVSTIIYHTDVFTGSALTSQADAQSYFPEWFLTGFGGHDINPGLARSMSPRQWRNAFGVSLREMARDPRDSECHRAVREVDPGVDVEQQMCSDFWPSMVQLFGAMQATGPQLTPERLVEAIPRMPVTKPDRRTPWAMSGFFGTADWSYSEYAAELWWDTDEPNIDGLAGAYRFPNCGYRYARGEYDASPSRAFTDGVTGVNVEECINRAGGGG